MIKNHISAENKWMMLLYAIFCSDTFTKSTGTFRYFNKIYRRKSIAVQKMPSYVYF